MPTKERRHACQWEGCEMKFSAPSKLAMHVRTHSGDRPFVCTFDGCQAAFTQRIGLVNHHQRLHTDERAFVCDNGECAARFATNGALAKHQRTHKGERSYICSYVGCSVAFVDSSNLKKHQLTHTGERAHVCGFEGCNKSFGREGDMRTHERIHTGQRPYICNSGGCTAVFIDAGKLSKHNRRFHSDEAKRHVCDFDGCTSGFHESRDLKVHQRTHTGMRPFACEHEECGATFRHSNTLKSHYFYWHTKEGQVRKKKDEARVLRLLQARGYDFKPQHHIDFKDENGKIKGIIFLEVDEHQHDRYEVSCELRRMADVSRTLTMEGNTFPVVFLRYNPHQYEVDGLKVKKPLGQRERELATCIESMQFTQPFLVRYMFYDTVDSKPRIFADADYDDSFKALVGPSIF